MKQDSDYGLLDANWVDSIGDATPDPDRTLVIILYPDDVRARVNCMSPDKVNDPFVVKTLNGYLEQFYEEGIIDGAHIFRYNPTPGEDYNMGLNEEINAEDPGTLDVNFKEKFIEKFATNPDAFLKTNGHDLIPAVHYGISSEGIFGGGAGRIDESTGDDTNNGSAFTVPQAMVCGIKEFNGDHTGLVRNFLIQEALHGFISEDIVNQYDDWLMEDDSLTPEHSLGTLVGDPPSGCYYDYDRRIWMCYKGSVTPMATTWTGFGNWQDAKRSNEFLAWEGRCKNELASWDSDYHEELTNCTLEALEITVNNDPNT